MKDEKENPVLNLLDSIKVEVTKPKMKSVVDLLFLEPATVERASGFRGRQRMVPESSTPALLTVEEERVKSIKEEMGKFDALKIQTGDPMLALLVPLLREALIQNRHIFGLTRRFLSDYTKTKFHPRVYSQFLHFVDRMGILKAYYVPPQGSKHFLLMEIVHPDLINLLNVPSSELTQAVDSYILKTKEIDQQREERAAKRNKLK